MSQQRKTAGCFPRRKRPKRIGPEPVPNLPPEGEATPTGDQDAPPGSEVTPAGNQRAPPGSEVTPAGNQRAPSNQNEPTATDQPSEETESNNTGNSGLAEVLEGRTNTLSDAEFRERENALMVTEETAKGSVLKTKHVEFHNKKNKEAHRTEDYEIEQLILRRGQTFDVSVTFDREYKPDEDVLLLQFTTGRRPQESKGSIIRVSVEDTLTPTRWGMSVKSVTGEQVHLSVMPSAEATIGWYDVYVETRLKDPSEESEPCRHACKEKICALFNAWCQDDTVYMEDEESRQEYVMRDFGYLWKGTADYPKNISWTFGQFEDVAFNSVFYLLDKAGISTAALSSPTHVVRAISAMVNSNDKDGGVLSGRWSPPFPPGTTAPLVWAGSTAILEEFWKTKKTVKYGQCWVFSGVSTTLSRALGIPTRSVTNYDSAHDSDASATIDYHFDEEGDFVSEKSDSVWNYHVWNESWFKRPDLLEGHDGWQAYDATPQETSEGVYQCGPASVKAVKNGEVYLPYDTRFVFAEVNGDLVNWLVKKDGSTEVSSVNKNAVGGLISTNAVGSNSREDLTREYKHPEGSEEERRAVQFAFKLSRRKEIFEKLYKRATEDVEFKIEVDKNVALGSSFEAAVVVKNISEITRSVTLKFSAVLVYYTGVVAKKLKGYKHQFLLNSNAEKRFVLTMEPSDYMSHTSTESSIKLFAKGWVEDTEHPQSIVRIKVVELEEPKFTITASPENVDVGKDVEVTVTLRNPLSVPLTKGQFHFEAPRMKPKSQIIDCKGPVGSMEEAKVTATFTATRKGTHHITVSFQSTELSGISGECTVAESSSDNSGM